MKTLPNLRLIAKPALPEREHFPTKRLQLPLVLRIPSLVLRQLRNPIFCASRRDVRIGASRMLVPETPPDFNDLFEPREHQIGFAGKFRGMKPVAVAHSVNKLAHDQLRRRIFASDSAHVCGTPFWSKCIGHTAKSRGRSAISFSRLPSTMILTKFAESSAPIRSTLAMSSGRAK